MWDGLTNTITGLIIMIMRRITLRLIKRFQFIWKKSNKE